MMMVEEEHKARMAKHQEEKNSKTFFLASEQSQLQRANQQFLDLVDLEDDGTITYCLKVKKGFVFLNMDVAIEPRSADLKPMKFFCGHVMTNKMRRRSLGGIQIPLLQ